VIQFFFSCFVIHLNMNCLRDPFVYHFYLLRFIFGFWIHDNLWTLLIGLQDNAFFCLSHQFVCNSACLAMFDWQAELAVPATVTIPTPSNTVSTSIALVPPKSLVGQSSKDERAFPVPCLKGDALVSEQDRMITNGVWGVQECVKGQIDIEQRRQTVSCTWLEFQIRQDLDNEGYLENGTTWQMILWFSLWFGGWFT